MEKSQKNPCKGENIETEVDVNIEEAFLEQRKRYLLEQ